MPKCRNCGEGFIPKKSSFCSEDCAHIHLGNLFIFELEKDFQAKTKN